MSLMSLLPDDYIAHQRQKRANLMCLLLFVAVMAGLGGAVLVSERKHQRTQEVCERVDKSYEEAGKLIQQMQELDVTRQSMLQKANLTAALLERVPRSYLLATITKALPEGASLTDFELSTKLPKRKCVPARKKTKFNKVAADKSKKKTPKTPKKVEIEITVTGLAGTDVQVGRFIDTMKRCPLIESANLVVTQEKEVEDCIMREFEVILHLKESADVQNQPSDTATTAIKDGTDKRES